MEDHSLEPAVYIVATPIGNLSDMSRRAVEVLNEVDVVACEDTRQTVKLLSHYEIPHKELVSYHDHIEESRAAELLSRIQKENISVAIVSDAGTPCVADPGFRIVEKAHKLGVKVHPVPGASALSSLVSAAGIPSNRFAFVGFLPTKAKALNSEIESWRSLGMPVVFYESPKRIVKTLKALLSNYEESTISIGRELTKFYEEIKTYSTLEALDDYSKRETIKGEIACFFDPALAGEVESSKNILYEIVRENALLSFKNGATHRDLMDRYNSLGLGKKQLYTLLLETQKEVE